MMEKLAFHAVTLGIPILLHVLWLARLQKQCPFLGLLIIPVVAVWIALWPVYFGPEHQRASAGPGDRVDSVVTGFVLLGWVIGLIACLPILLVEIPRSIVLSMRKRQASKAIPDNTKGEQVVPPNT